MKRNPNFSHDFASAQLLLSWHKAKTNARDNAQRRKSSVVESELNAKSPLPPERAFVVRFRAKTVLEERRRAEQATHEAPAIEAESLTSFGHESLLRKISEESQNFPGTPTSSSLIPPRVSAAPRSTPVERRWCRLLVGKPDRGRAVGRKKEKLAAHSTIRIRKLITKLKGITCSL